jgi:16S rRNA (adenine1518-N6/adenine1519-N6)-dimethyltransferase
MEFALSLKETVEQYGLMAKKSLGQNFLLNSNITDKIIRLSLEKQGLKDFSGRCLFEVGPGPGGLTRAVLSNNPLKLTVVEMDERCIKIMEDLRDSLNVPLDIINADALTLNFAAMEQTPRQVISNLPYNISVPLLTGWLKNMEAYEALTLMFQKEVAERITASIGTKSYGRISVLAQLICRVDKLLDLNPECFVPAPKIWSTVLLFRPLADIPSAELLSKVEMLTAAAFGQRRKMVRQSLKPVAGVESACRAAGVELTARAENITPEQYLLMAQNL